MSLKLRLLQHKRKDLNGKWYARVTKGDEIHTRQLANAICHQTSFTEADVHGVIRALTDEMKRQLQSGNTVVIDDFGRFHLTIKSELVDKKEDFDLAQHVKRIMCKFTPSATRNPFNRRLEHNFIEGTELSRV